MRIPDLSGTEAWKGGDTLPPGRHRVAVSEAKEDQARSGNLQLVLKLRAVGGDYQGGTITDWITITANTLGRVKQVLQALGRPIPEGEFDLQPSSLIGAEAEIFIKTEPKQDGSGNRNVVSAYTAADGAPAASNGAAPVAAGVGASQHDDDIPF